MYCFAADHQRHVRNVEPQDNDACLLGAFWGVLRIKAFEGAWLTRCGPQYLRLAVLLAVAALIFHLKSSSSDRKHCGLIIIVLHDSSADATVRPSHSRRITGCVLRDRMQQPDDFPSHSRVMTPLWLSRQLAQASTERWPAER
jgi:hypothetical protein